MVDQPPEGFDVGLTLVAAAAFAERTGLTGIGGLVPLSCR
jgi:hypothetical protein